MKSKEERKEEFMRACNAPNNSLATIIRMEVERGVIDTEDITGIALKSLTKRIEAVMKLSDDEFAAVVGLEATKADILSQFGEALKQEIMKSQEPDETVS